MRIDTVSTVSLSETVCYLPGEGDSRQPVMSIYVFSGSSREEDAALYRQLQALASNASGLYRCGLSDSVDPAYALDIQQARELFRTIEVSWNAEEY